MFRAAAPSFMDRQAIDGPVMIGAKVMIVTAGPIEWL